MTEKQDSSLRDGVKEALLKLSNSGEHQNNCIGYSEGQLCCLQKDDVVDLVTSMMVSRMQRAQGSD